MLLATMKETLPQVWDVMHSWFTPTVLFLLLNVVIGTIAVTSGMRHNNKKEEHGNNLRKSQSLLSRLTSMDFSGGKAEEVVKEEITSSALGKREMENKTLDNAEGGAENNAMEEPSSPVLSARAHDHFRFVRRKSDTPPTGDLQPPPLPSRLKKSGTFESVFGHFASEVSGPPPIRVMEVPPNEHLGSTMESEDNGLNDPSTDEVNAKADDFINKFKRELKLQRLESITRYKEMVRRGH